jgi:hypothetical protein
MPDPAHAGLDGAWPIPPVETSGVNVCQSLLFMASKQVPTASPRRVFCRHLSATACGPRIIGYGLQEKRGEFLPQIR